MKATILELVRRFPGAGDATRGSIPPHSACAIVEAGIYDELIVNQKVVVNGRTFTVSAFYPAVEDPKGGPSRSALFLCAGWQNQFPFDAVSVGDEIVMSIADEPVPPDLPDSSHVDETAHASGLVHSSTGMDVAMDTKGEREDDDN